MNNQNDIKRAMREVRQDREAADYDELRDVQEFFRMNAPHADCSDASDVIYRTSKTGAMLDVNDIINVNNCLYMSVDEKYFTDEDGDGAVQRKFILITDDDFYIAYEKSRRFFDKKDKLKHRVEKFLDWNINKPLPLPADAELMHTFISREIASNDIAATTKRIFRSDDKFYIEQTLHRRTQHYELFCNTGEGIYNVAFAVAEAVAENKELEEIRKNKNILDAMIKEYRRKYRNSRI